MMLNQSCGASHGAAGRWRQRRGIGFRVTGTQPLPMHFSSTPTPSPSTSTAAAASASSIAVPDPSIPAPLSYRAATTDPTFHPATAGCQQYAPGPPQLLGRRITLNPLHGIAAAAEAQLSRLDLGFAAVMDSVPILHAVAAVVTAALTLLGLHPLRLLQHGLPDAASDWLETQVGEWLLPLAGAAALAVGLAAALWQVRTWVAVQLAVFRFDQALQGAEDTRAAAKVHAAAAAAAAAAAGGVAVAAAVPSGPFAKLIPEPLRGLFEEDWKATDRTWLYVIIAARLGTLLTAANSLLSGATGAAAAYTALCFGASLLPLALPHLRSLLAAAAPPSSSGTAPAGGAVTLAAPLLAADAAFLLTLAPAAPLAARAAAAAVLAAGLGLAAVAAAAAPRLAAKRAAEGDLATFHVVLRVPLSGTLIDTTVGHHPLSSRVGDAAAAASASQSPSASTDPRVVGSIAGAGCDPQERFRPLQVALGAAALPGMYVGEKRTVLIAAASAPETTTATSSSGSSGGSSGSSGSGRGEGVVDAAVDTDSELGLPDSLPFRNPGLVWWQRLDDLQRKLGKGANGEERPVRTGDVFWYPVGSLVTELGSTRLSTQQQLGGAGEGPAVGLAGADSWGPVEVAAVAGEWVQLDANAGLSGGEVEVEVELVGLRKAAELAAA